MVLVIKSLFFKFKATGILIDLMNYIGNLYNFTYEIDKELSGKWGNLDFEFDTDPTSNNSGLVENFLFKDNDYDCALSNFYMKLIREQYWESAWPFQPFRLYLIYNKNTFDTRGSVLLRPFKTNSWTFIILLFSFGYFILLLLSALEQFFNLSVRLSKRITITVLWFLFVIIHAFYDGSLTMFFADGSGLPFRSLVQGLDYYPAWTLALGESKTQFI